MVENVPLNQSVTKIKLENEFQEKILKGQTICCKKDCEEINQQILTKSNKSSPLGKRKAKLINKDLMKDLEMEYYLRSHCQENTADELLLKSCRQQEKIKVEKVESNLPKSSVKTKSEQKSKVKFNLKEKENENPQKITKLFPLKKE